MVNQGRVFGGGLSARQIPGNIPREDIYQRSKIQSVTNSQAETLASGKIVETSMAILESRPVDKERGKHSSHINTIYRKLRIEGED